MSGSGGYYKYRCKYFYTHNCTNWVYINKTACANCAVSQYRVELKVTLRWISASGC